MAPLFPVILAALLKMSGDGSAFSYAAVGLEILMQWAIVLLLPSVSKRLLNSLAIGYFAAAAVIACNKIAVGWEASTAAVFLEIAVIVPASALISGVLIGLGTLLSPSVGLSIAIMHFRWNRVFAVSLALAALLCVPWTVRNYFVFHRFIPVRDSFGLAMRLSYNPYAAVTAEESRVSFFEYEPTVNPALKTMLSEMGEAAFYERLGEDANKWIRTNIGKSLKLLALRIASYWFPQDRPVLLLFTIFSFAAIWFLRSDARLMRLVLALMVVFPLPYYVVVTSTRYRAPTLWFTGLLVGTLIWKIPKRARDGAEANPCA